MVRNRQLTVGLQVNVYDEDDPESPARASPRRPQPIPNSPPPSFHSRASSISRESRVDQTLADAFDTEGDDSDDDADDRQRLVRQPAQPSPPSNATQASTRPAPSRPAAAVPPVAGSENPTTPFRVYGGGIQSDGVFSNLTAKPELGEAKEEQPPVGVPVRTIPSWTSVNTWQTYEQAAADAAPPYWETTILAPGLGGPDEVYIDGMPVGSVFSFAWNAMISSTFHFIGFVLTYLLHSTHAAKNGSRAGLGVTMIRLGFLMKGNPGSGAGGMGAGYTADSQDGYANPPDPNSHDFDPNTVNNDDGGNGSIADIASSEWLSYILMIVGWFILIRAVTDYLKARRHEQLVLQSPDRGLGVAIIAEGEDPERVV